MSDIPKLKFRILEYVLKIGFGYGMGTRQVTYLYNILKQYVVNYFKMYLKSNGINKKYVDIFLQIS